MTPAGDDDENQHASLRTSADSARGRRRNLLRIGAVVGLVVGLFLFMRTVPIAPVLSRLESTVDSLGIAGILLFAAVYVIAAVAFVPGSALTLAAGAIFGLPGGFIVVSLSATIAAAISFLIARHLARGAVHQMAAGSPTFAAVDAAIGEGGWRIVLMLRLVPVFPFSAGNYLLGLTPIRFWHYVLASWIGMMPGTFLYVYFGHVGRAGLDAAAGTGARSPLEWTLVVVGLLAALAVTVLITRLVRRKLDERLADAGPAEGDAVVLDSEPLPSNGAIAPHDAVSSQASSGEIRS